VEKDDFDLLQKIQDGDTNALKHALCKLKCYLIMRFKGSPCVINDAEEIAVEAIIRALKKRHEFRGEAKLITWLEKFAYYAAMEHRRKNGKDELLEIEHELIADSRPNPEEQLIEDDEAQLRQAYASDALAVLNDRERQAVELVYLERMGVKELAKSQGTTEDAISSLLRRAKQKMRDKLKGIAW
jgi:RNA polymerase sigma-70 factor (ECF subfamily)